ncbi:TRAP transporter substrate-binding protein [Clostridium sp. DL1XJH146]
MKRITSIILICLLGLGCLAGCGNKAVNNNANEAEANAEEATADPAPQEEIIMKIGHAQPTTTPRHKSLLKFKELVEEKSNNVVKVEIYPSAQLGTEAEMIEQMKLGTIQGVRAGVIDAIAPEMLIYTMPFLFEDIDGFQKVASGSIGEKIAKYAEVNNIKVLATGDAGGFRQISNNEHPITSPEDMKGLKMRTPPIDSITKTMEALGANPVSIPYVETYMGLKTGVADGQENPFVNIESMKFNEVQKYLTVINYQVHPDPFDVNLEWFESLDPEIQTIIAECAEESMRYSDQLMTEGNTEAYEKIKNTMEITELTADERQVFIDKVQPVYDYYIGEGLFTMDDIDEIREATK